MFVFWSIRKSFLKSFFHFWCIVVSCKWRQILYLIMCYDFMGSINLLSFLRKVQNFILGLRMNHNFILRIRPEEDSGKKYIIRNEPIILKHIHPKKKLWASSFGTSKHVYLTKKASYIWHWVAILLRHERKPSVLDVRRANIISNLMSFFMSSWFSLKGNFYA